MKSENSIAVTAFAPVSAKVKLQDCGVEKEVSIKIDTDYPFRDSVKISLMQVCRQLKQHLRSVFRDLQKRRKCQ